MVKFFIALAATLSISWGSTQVILYQDDFENLVSTWETFSSSTPNYWITNVCAGNGIASPGSNSIYVTPGGAAPGCGTNGAINYTYLPSDNGGSKSTIIAHEVVGNCAINYQIQFDYLISIADVNDFAELVYSTDEGITWTVVGAPFSNVVPWTTETRALPVSINNSTFLVGFRFTYDHLGTTGTPLAIDNVRITGTDVVAPVAICPPNQVLYANTTCENTLEDYTTLMTGTDNCYVIAPLTYAQSPAIGAIISANTIVTMTAEDPSGNEGTCTFTVQLIDTIKPQIQCQNEILMPINASCGFLVPDLEPTVVATDNCATNPLLTFSQSITIGTAVTGPTSVIVMVLDTAGNSKTCTTLLVPDDQEAPQLTCPPTQTVNNGVSCLYTLTNLTNLAIVSDNCTTNSVFQSPAPGTQVQTGNHVITFTAEDASGNESTCTFTLFVEENIDPVISVCPTNISQCNPVVSFAAVQAVDNCVVYVVQTDQTGLSSGSTFPVGITTLEYTAIDSSGNQDVCTFNVEIFPSPSIPVITESLVDLCETTTYSLNANLPTSGTGAWTQIQGTASITNSTSNSTPVTNLSSGSNVFLWTISSAGCGSLSDTIVVNNNPTPTTVNIFADSTFACDDETTMLLGTFPLFGSGLWTTTSTATIANATNHNASATNLSPGWNTFIYTISSGNCPSTSDSIHIYADNSAQILTVDTTLCFESDEMLVVGNLPDNAQSIAWYFIQGQGNVVTPNSNASVVNSFTASTNRLVYRLSHPICGFSYDTLQIQVENCESDDLIIPSIITPNFDGKNDLFVIINLHEVYPDCKVAIVNRWGSLVYESDGYATPWDGTNNGEELPMGTYFYNIQLNDAAKTVYSGPISIVR